MHICEPSSAVVIASPHTSLCIPVVITASRAHRLYYNYFVFVLFLSLLFVDLFYHQQQYYKPTAGSGAFSVSPPPALAPAGRIKPPNRRQKSGGTGKGRTRERRGRLTIRPILTMIVIIAFPAIPSSLLHRPHRRGSRGHYSSYPSSSTLPLSGAGALIGVSGPEG